MGKVSVGAVVMVGIQLLLMAGGLVLTGLWMAKALPWQGWWSNLPAVGVLVASLLVFSHQEARWGLSARRRPRHDPEAMGGWLEAVAFSTWLFLLLNTIATVAKVVRALRG